MKDDNNTAASFRDKWRMNKDLAFTETLREGSDIQRWILQRNGFTDKQALTGYLRGKKRVLDAGCGNGRVAALLRECSDPETTEIVGIDLVAADVAEQNLAGQPNVRVYQKDILGDLTDLGMFDFIYCQEVLHHTGNPRSGLLNLSRLLTPGGEVAVYVYKKKAPAREFVDDYIRREIAPRSYDEAMAVCDQIAALGKTLSETGVKIKVPAVDLLEIPAGEYDLQRFIYHFFMKCFWNPDLSFHDNAVINYDWYHPQLCSRHTIEEVRQWFADCRLTIVHEFVDFYGITIRGCRAP